MESFVFQISKYPLFGKVKPASDDPFMRTYSDFWIDVKEEEYKYVIQSLNDNLAPKGGITVDVDAGTITVENKEAYFESNLRDVKLLVEKMTTKDISNNSHVLGQIRKALNDIFSFRAYLGDSYNRVMSFDDFVRYAQNGATYYIGHISTYHA